MTRSFLYTAIDGARSGAPFFVLHDRNGQMADAIKLGAFLGDKVRRIAVRSARVQVAGANGRPLGNFWYIGPRDRPELSTLGDGLYQLEQLLLEEIERKPGEPIGLLAEGEGGTVALLMALLWHDKVRRVILIDAAWPQNLAQMPIEDADLSGLDVLLIDTDGDRSKLVRDNLAARGAKVTAGTRADIGNFAAG